MSSAVYMKYMSSNIELATKPTEEFRRFFRLRKNGGISALDKAKIGEKTECINAYMSILSQFLTPYSVLNRHFHVA